MTHCPVNPEYNVTQGYIGLDDRWYDGLKRIASSVRHENDRTEITVLQEAPHPSGLKQSIETAYCITGLDNSSLPTSIMVDNLLRQILCDRRK